ncbi:helix-turn-helix domain-containing protein [Stackebrandtia soli]|uniref:helix-turn-helix domain-containing protein n=1 Tax=Stackebrandtia soli TaxID=1892856 RepID=UPI0039ECE305
MPSLKSSASELARRLRSLRERTWRGVAITQRDLAHALGGHKPLSVPLISSWENTRRPTVPPVDRLLAYAAFFATRRSVEDSPYRIVPDGELTPSERESRDRLERELLALRDRALRTDVAGPSRRNTAAAEDLVTGPWHFGDGNIVTIVCAEVPESQREVLPTPDDPYRAFADLYSYADADSLIELYGHVRAANPTTEVVFRKARDLQPDDYTTHLILLGGVDWNLATNKVLEQLDLPVRQLAAGRSGVRGRDYRVRVGDEEKIFKPQWSDDARMLSDVGHFVRTPNPFNHKRTLTICNGTDSRGVLGVVRSLTDWRFRSRNADYLREATRDHLNYSLLIRVKIVDFAAVTPDWTNPKARLHEWRR